MTKEVKSVNKRLYKLELYSAKVVPMLMAGITLAMLDYYGVDDADEPPAYTIGFLLIKMLQVFDNL